MPVLGHRRRLRAVVRAVLARQQDRADLGRHAEALSGGRGLRRRKPATYHARTRRMASRSDKNPAAPTGMALETWRAQPSSGDAIAKPAAAPALSILYHAELHRVGEQLVMHDLHAGEDVLLSRTAPEFVSRLRAVDQPLADRNLSRSPVRFSAS